MPLVYPVIHLIPHGLVDVIRIHSVADIAEVVRDSHVDNLTSADGRIDFWFSPSLKESQVPNRRATELLLLATRFTASSVPLLRGQVVLASHDSSGRLAGLTDGCLDQLRMPNMLSWLDHRVLDRRFANDARARRATSRAGLRRIRGHVGEG
ncbi:hypothetical protein [Mycobacterium sp.]|uniref:hypothetical protein n=1 Tax=Mycobacterium sp. TaxID=1785 RepID=UPI002B94BEDD|nr:hypothetical protein [Mycobacterium sp.]HTQ18826.1 hypothetical protein [Mycobacterium sp.]